MRFTDETTPLTITAACIKQAMPNQATTWLLFGKSIRGNLCGLSLFILVINPKLSFYVDYLNRIHIVEMKLETLLVLL